MAAIRLTRKQATKLTGQTEEHTPCKNCGLLTTRSSFCSKACEKAYQTPKQPKQPRQEARTIEKACRVVNPAIGQKWRLRKDLRPVTVTPPPVGTVCVVWQITERRLYLLGDGYSFDVSREQLGEFFEEVVSE